MGMIQQIVSYKHNEDMEHRIKEGRIVLDRMSVVQMDLCGSSRHDEVIKEYTDTAGKD